MLKKVIKTGLRKSHTLHNISPGTAISVVSKSARLSHLKSHSKARPYRQIKADVVSVKEILQRLVKPELADGWFHKKIPSLNERTPMQMIRRGKTHLVLEVLMRVEEGIHL